MHPDDLRYHNEHTWVRTKGNTAIIGITDYAQQALGEIMRIELPEAGDTVEAGQEIGVVISSKAASSLVSPLSGAVLRVNESLDSTPRAPNEEPYGEGWILELEVSDPSELDDLMGSADYARYIEHEGGW